MVARKQNSLSAGMRAEVTGDGSAGSDFPVAATARPRPRPSHRAWHAEQLVPRGHLQKTLITCPDKGCSQELESFGFAYLFCVVLIIKEGTR